MGYEIKIIIGLKGESKEKIKDKFYNYVQPVAIYNYCSDYVLADFLDQYAEDSGCYTYVERNNAPAAFDCYGRELRAIDLKLLLDYFEAVEDETKFYRRFKPFKLMLQGFLENKEQFDSKLIVLTYGY